jgi:ABC-2 type transport system permease protein
MLKNKTLIVAKYEYLKTVKKPAFWLTTILMPILIGVVTFISGYSGEQGEQLLGKLDESIKLVYIVDETDLVPAEVFEEPLIEISNKQKAIDDVRIGTADAVIFIPESLLENAPIEIYAKEKGLLGSFAYTTLADNIVKTILLSNIPSKFHVLELGTPTKTTTLFDSDGNEVSTGYARFIVPAASFAIFFLAVFVSGQFLLQSVSEEKDSRIVEILMTMIKPENLINGKLIGLTSVVLTQLLIWIVLSLIIGFVVLTKLPFNLDIDFSEINLASIPLNLLFTINGFLMFAAVMVGVGSVAANYKDSQNLSSIFIILAISPIYFFMTIVSDPFGVISYIASYFPLTSPMIFIIRNSITQLPLWEIIIGILATSFYAYISFKLAVMLFKFGALEYDKRIQFSAIKSLLLGKTKFNRGKP